MQLGVCWYPEQWPADWWADDARRMREMGITWVRIGEFAWSQIEPAHGRFEWAWLDRAFDTLHAQQLKVMLGTPTATPPKWLVDAHPDILAVGADGRVRGFGSRRHYCFSSPTYRAQSARIVRAVAERYGQHPALAAWQTDNEYACHDTAQSYSDAARLAFRRWLAQRFNDDINALNDAWGTTFWSQIYASFDDVDPPIGSVTEAHPALRLAFRRFSSDQIAAFNREQVAILRELSPGRPIAHNYMGFFTEFDHHAVARDLDIATWDSYPLGFTQDRAGLSDDDKRTWMRTGHPDIPAFHHDLYRGMGKGGRWWVMEQQPGPVNWARWNPAPLPGMVRLWTWQAFAHGAEVVSYFRWRQARHAQEQMHAALHRPDREIDQGGIEATQVGAELARLEREGTSLHGLHVRAPVALLFDYASQWIGDIQPQGTGYSAIHECFRAYSALRALGLDVDVLAPDADLAGYKLIGLPAMLHATDELAAALQATTAQVVIGARGGSKDAELAIATPLPPGPLADLLGLRVTRVESLPPGIVEHATGLDRPLAVHGWRERIELRGAEIEATFADGSPALIRHHRARYLVGFTNTAGWTTLLERAAHDAGLRTKRLPEGLRTNRIGTLAIACNVGDQACVWKPEGTARALLGGPTLAPRDVAVWQLDAPTT